MSGAPELEILPDAAAVAERGAAVIVEAVRERLATAPRAAIAVSGGRTPLKMFERLAAIGLPWERLDLFQVDERVAPAGHADRNATSMAAAFATALRSHPSSFHWCPVEAADLAAGAESYAGELRAAAGRPPTLDLVHLGLGPDGHTASLFPGAPLNHTGPVAVSGPHLGRVRMTLTLPVLNRARRIVWMVTGADKGPMLAGLLAGKPDVVASRVRRTGALILADQDAGAALR